MEATYWRTKSIFDALDGLIETFKPVVFCWLASNIDYAVKLTNTLMVIVVRTVRMAMVKFFMNCNRQSSKRRTQWVKDQSKVGPPNHLGFKF